jgi:glycosyltransferase involved in cell wall biosynthesis
VGGPSVWKNVSGVMGAEEVAKRVEHLEQRELIRCGGALPRSAMPAFWGAVDVAVVPSLYEPFGLVALEALACGVPVIASAVGGLREIVADGECALARALRLLLTNEPLRRRLAAGARLRAQQFSLQRRSRELLTLILERTVKAA